MLIYREIYTIHRMIILIGQKVSTTFLPRFFGRLRWVDSTTPSIHGFYIRWLLISLCALRTHGVNQTFRFVEGIWLHRKSRQIRFFLSEKDLVFIIRAQRK